MGSRYAHANSFKTCKDWTKSSDDNNDASQATRHYIYASVPELKSLVTHLCRLDSRLKAMIAPPPSSKSSNNKRRKTSSDNSSSNSLADADVSYSVTPSPAVSEAEMPQVDATQQEETSALTVERVDALFCKHGLTGESQCLRAAVLRGHYKLDDSVTPDTVLYESGCYLCSKPLSITWGQAAEQSDYAGLDYEDGGQEAEVKCSECDNGNYITALCKGDPSFDSGKFHNHCSECPNFGICIHDYREQHCDNCGEHYFAGLSGFACQNCGGGGKADKLLAKLKDPQPDLSAWNGQVRGKEVAMEFVADSDMAQPLMAAFLAASLTEGNPVEAEMMRLFAASFQGQRDEDNE